EYAGQLQVQREEARPGADLERLPVRPAARAGDRGEAVAGVVDAAFVVRDRPLLVVRRRFPVVVQHLGELVVVPSRLDIFGGRGGLRSSRHHFPLNSALPGPFSTNEVIPITRSSVANSAANCCRSISSPVVRSTPRPESIDSLAARSA